MSLGREKKDINSTASVRMSNLPARYVPPGGIRPRGSRGGPRGGARGGLRGGPRGGSGSPFNNQQPRGGYGGNQGYPPNAYSQHQQQQRQMLQGGYFDPFGNWVSGQPFHPFNNSNNGGGYVQPQVRNNQWRDEQQSVSNDQGDDAATSLASLKTKYNKTQGQLLAMKDENTAFKDENRKLVQENAELRERSGTLIKNVADFGKMMRELEARNKLLRAQLDRGRGREASVEEDGVKQRKIVVDEDEVDGLLIKGFTSGKVKSGGKDEGGVKTGPRKHREKGAMKNSREAMKALVEVGEKKEIEAEINDEGEAEIPEQEVVEEEEEEEDKESAPKEIEIDFTVAVDANAEDEIDWDFDELDGVEEAVVPEVKAVEVKTVEVKTKKRKAGEDGEANVVEKKPKRVRNRR